ncbi:hypothetical protein F53441_7166 [Fusarium austroafricanum]|uniref:Uncharacterized protein n=1 Tax=Fusarium austroafricanum TaxID=2364996 RepID=A0A8H4KH57_9HYPO|nr:hypothetical protein F53441_7166 [Fusarium austroafricanum]
MDTTFRIDNKNVCKMLTLDDPKYGWSIPMCFVDDFDFDYLIPKYLRSGDDVKNNLTTGDKYNFWPVLLLNSSIHEDDYLPLKVQMHNLTFKMEDGSLWSKGYDTNGSVALSASVCNYNINAPQMYNVTISGSGILSEPEPDKVNDIRLQLDTKYHPGEYSKRGILELNISKINMLIYTDLLGDDAFEIERLFQSVNIFLPNESKIGWCMALSSGANYMVWMPNPYHVSLFQNMIQKDADPAPAVNALMTRLYQMTYYDRMDHYSLEFPVTTVNTTNRLMPLRWTGLIIVLVLIATHLGLVFMTMTLFVLETKTSALGIAWHTLAQTVRMTNVVETADMMLDKEIKKQIKATGRDKEVYTISRSTEVWRVDVQLCWNSGRTSEI